MPPHSISQTTISEVHVNNPIFGSQFSEENDYIAVIIIYHTTVQHAYAEVIHHSMSHSNLSNAYRKKTIAHRLTPYFQTENNHVCITIHIKRDSIVSLRPYSDYDPYDGARQ